MDFTQIMQRYTRLRERFEQGEIDAESFEQQVNGMIYKDEQGRYWQIGVQTGLWYYYDGTRWVQDDLVEDTPADEEPVVEEVEKSAIDEIFPDTEADSAEDEPSPFDMAFEEQLASQFAEGSNSQVFDLFDDTDIFASILKGKGIDPDEDPLAAPAEEVEGLAQHLESTQPVSIESLMGEGTAISPDEGGDDFDFLFEEGEDAYPAVEEGGQFDLSAVLGKDLSEFDELDEVEEASFPETDVREVREGDVATGELAMPGEPLTKEVLDKLMAEENEITFGADEDRTAVAPFELLIEDEKEGLDWELEAEDSEEFDVEEAELPNSPMLQVLDDDFSLDDLVAESEQDYLEETQPVPARAAAAYYEEDEEEIEAPFEIPMQADILSINTIPEEVSEPAGETLHTISPARPKRKLPLWVTLLIVFIAVFGIVIATLLGWRLISALRGTDLPAAIGLGDNSSDIAFDDPKLMLYDSFTDPTEGDWPQWNEVDIRGAVGYHSGFYFIYATVPEVPTAVVAGVDPASDIVIDVETTQLNENFPDTLSTYGVMCRVQENGDGYAFRITNNGQYAIERYQLGVFVPINGWKYSEVIKADKKINTNHIEVKCEGSQLSLFVNGHLLDLVTDNTWASGVPGLVAQSGAAGTVTEVHYDELYLLKP